jgi:hypothetical protein
MEVYKFKNLDNGDILLEKVVLDNTNYTIKNKNNGDKILKKITTVNITDINDIKKYDFRKSNILSCLLNDDEITKLKYKSVLENIYKIINDGTKIIKNSKLNIKTIKKLDEGFYYLEDLGISIQGVDSNKCLLEIINQCIENEISLIMKIKLNDETNININF